MHSFLRTWLLVASLSCAGCAETTTDAEGEADLSVGDDSYTSPSEALRRRRDAGTDAGLPADAGTDAALPKDAGTDAGLPADAGIDAALPKDAGTDAALPKDAGIDAAPPNDAAAGSAPTDSKWSHVAAGYTGQYWANGEPGSFQDVAGNRELVFPALRPSTGLALFVSSDLGGSWHAVGPLGGGSPLAAQQFMSAVQSSDGKVHLLTLSTFNYTRLTLNRTAGAITSYSIDSGASAVPIAPASYAGDARGSIQVVYDQSGAECLMMVVNGNGGGGMSVFARKTLSTTPSSASAWTTLDGAAGSTTVYSAANPNGNNHEHNAIWSQFQASRDVMVIASRCPAEGYMDGTMDRVRLTASGPHTWSVGPVVTGVLGAQARSITPAAGRLLMLTDYINPAGAGGATGISIDAIAEDGTFTRGYVAAPPKGSPTAALFQGAISSNPSGSRIYVAFQTWTTRETPVSEKAAYINGAWIGYPDTLNDVDGTGDCWGMKQSTKFDGLIALRFSSVYGDFSSWVSTIAWRP